jgi:regulator of protease activity HflC (stomatin/prohibitin superfamily)
MKTSLIPTNAQIFDPPAYKVKTRDRIEVSVNIVLFYQIVNPRQACFEVDDLLAGLQNITETCVVETAAKMNLEEIVIGGKEIEAQIVETFKELEGDWGIVIRRVDVQQVDPPKDLNQATTNIAIERRRREADYERQRAQHEAELAALKLETERQQSRIQSEHQTEILRQKLQAEKLQLELECLTKRREAEFQLQRTEQAVKTESYKHTMREWKSGGLSTEHIVDLLRLEELQHLARTGAVKFLPQPLLPYPHLLSSAPWMEDFATAEHEKAIES